MTYTYTPQAGDVIESPDGFERFVIHYRSTGGKTLRSNRYGLGPDGWKKRTSGDIIMRPENYTKLVTDHGWKLIARRDQ